MKHYPLLRFIVLTSFISITGSVSAVQAQSESNPENEQLVASYIDNVIAGDLDMAKTMLHEDFMSRGPAVSDSANADQVMQTWTQTHENYTDVEASYVSLSWRVEEEGPYKGDWVAQWGTYKATHKALGKSITIPYHNVSFILDGKIRSMRSYWDNAAAVLQLGGTVSVPGEESDSN